MPELPEVETTRRGILPHVKGRRVVAVTLRQRRLRWPVSREVKATLPGQRIEGVSRRGKYLLLHCKAGALMIHLGMSGSLRLLRVNKEKGTAAGKHDHLDILFDNRQLLRFHDPRRFGSLLWVDGPDLSHPLLDSLGPEPLGDDFSGDYLFARSRGRRAAVKTFIMDSRIVVGVGNIYANEALYLAGIHPGREAGRVSRQRYQRLGATVREVLGRAIDAGGTTLRDFIGSDGRPGYFSQSLYVYGRAGLPCAVCGRALKEMRLGQRATVYCSKCQR